MKIHEIIDVEMNKDDEIEEVAFGALLELACEDGKWAVIVDGEIQDYFATLSCAEDEMNRYAIDPELVIKGYGTYAGRKFWQIPCRIKTDILKIAIIED